MPYLALTLAQLRTRLIARYDRSVFWTDTEANRAINESLLTWGMLTGRWKRRITLETTANTHELALPATMVYRSTLRWNGYPLSPCTRFDLDYGKPLWRGQHTLTGGAVPSRPSLWAPVSLQLIYVWPADAVSHNAWTIDGVSATPTLAADGDFVDLAEADVNVLLGFALHILAFKKGGVIFQALEPYFRQFLQAAAEENSLITTAQFYRKFMGLDQQKQQPQIGAATPVASLAGGSQ